jgi:hypothetical protein
MISKITAVDWIEEETTSDVFECLVSDDRLELIEMLVDRMKTMEASDSVIVNLVTPLDDEDQSLLDKMEFKTKSEGIYLMNDHL